MARFEAFPACTFVGGSNPTRFSFPTIALPTNLARPSGWQTNERICHMAWALLSIAGILEIAFAFCMKWSEGFTRLIPGLFTIRHWLVECLPSLTLTAHTASGNWLCRLDGYRRGGHRNSGNSGAGRLRCADEDALHWSHFDRRDRIKAGFGKLRTIAGLGRLDPCPARRMWRDAVLRVSGTVAAADC